MKPLLLAALATLTACVAEEPTEAAWDETLGTPESPIPEDDSYSVVSRLQVGFPASQVDAALADLRAVAQNPARALLTQGGSQVQALYGVLSQSLKDRLEGWINTEIDKARIGGKTLRQFAGDVATITETVLTQFTIESSLTIAPTGVTHTLTGLNFRPLGVDIIVPVGGLKADTLMQSTTGTVAELGSLTLGEQRFSLAFGSHAWQGINLATESLFGGDLGAALVGGIDCRSVAQTVATRCYSGVCVGHATEVQAICEAGMDALVDELAAHMPGFKLDAFTFARGTGRLVDDNRNGVAERIVDGAWDVQVDIGGGVRTVPGTFIAEY